MAKRKKITRKKRVTRPKIKRGRGRPKKYTSLESFSERSLQYFLYTHYKELGSTYICRNKYIYSWEVDAWHINRLGYHVEQECKISRSDVNKEWKDKPVKHQFLKETWECGGENLIEGELYCPNQFVMTCPENLISVEEVEDMFPYAGLVWVTDKGQVKTKIKKYVHKRKMNMDGVLLRKFYSTMSNLEYESYMMLKKINGIGEEGSAEQYKNLIKDYLKNTRI